MQAGADDYMIKPFSARELITRVAAHLKLAKARQEANDRERSARDEAEADPAERGLLAVPHQRVFEVASHRNGSLRQ